MGPGNVAKRSMAGQNIRLQVHSGVQASSPFMHCWAAVVGATRAEYLVTSPFTHCWTAVVGAACKQNLHSIFHAHTYYHILVDYET